MSLSFKTQRLRHKLWVVYALMFVLPVLFLLYIIGISFFPIFKLTPLPAPLMKMTLIVGVAAIIMMSLGGFILLYRSLKPIERVTKNTAEFLNEIGKGITGLAETEDEAEKISQYVTSMVVEIRNKIVEVDRYAHDLAEHNKKLSQLAIKDGLTGLYNQIYIKERLDNEFLRAKQFNHPLAVIMMDLDDFKRFNDSFGHLAGDQILKEVGSSLVKNIRPIDIPARYGGEEFLIILPETTMVEAHAVAEQIRQGITQLSFLTTATNGARHITASLGIGTMSGEDISRDGLIARADEALYRAKKIGKNRVAV